MDLNTVWFILIGFLLAGYAVLDGFDLGVGALHLLARDDRQRRIFLNSIAPVWDGNEVWLVAGGGALFAAFPDVYAAVFSGFYFAFMLVLFSLILRAVSIEFRSKQPMAWWRGLWDAGFSSGSILAAVLFGVAMGNIVRGVPLSAAGEYTGRFMDLLNPYSLLAGLTTLALFVLHGSLYLLLKTEGELHDRVRRWALRGQAVLTVCLTGLTVLTVWTVPRATETMRQYPVLFMVPALMFLALMKLPREISLKNDRSAFGSSCFVIAGLMTIVGIGLYPNLVPSVPHPEFSLTVFNAASSKGTLGVMLVIALLGIPFALAYNVFVYRIFRGKVKLEEESY